jgi:hypothetical protein
MLQLLAVVVSLTAFIVAAYSVQVKHYSFAHGALGLAIVIVSILQPVLGQVGLDVFFFFFLLLCHCSRL